MWGVKPFLHNLGSWNLVYYIDSREEIWSDKAIPIEMKPNWIWAWPSEFVIFNLIFKDMSTNWLSEIKQRKAITLGCWLQKNYPYHTEFVSWRVDNFSFFFKFFFETFLKISSTFGCVNISCEGYRRSLVLKLGWFVYGSVLDDLHIKGIWYPCPKNNMVVASYIYCKGTID